MSNLDFMTEQTAQAVLSDLTLITAYMKIFLNGWDLSSWQAAGAIIESGHGSEAFKVADACNVKENNVAQTYDVLGNDEEVPVTAAHVMSMIRRNVLQDCVFDPPQYLFAVTAEACAYYGWPTTGDNAGMPIGTYHITGNHIANNNSTDADTSYQFTTTKVVPIGGGVRHSNIGSKNSISDICSGTFITYAADRTTTLESNLVCTEGTGGTNLGTATLRDPQYKSGNYINFSERNMWGGNRWSTSWIRQVMNSNEAVVSFTPGTIWSRPGTSQAGFLYSLDNDIKSAIGKVRKRYALSISDGYGYEDIEDYVTLETMLDIYGSQNNNISEGPVTLDGTVKRTVAHSLYKDVLTTNSDKIKTKNGAAAYWWLSSATPSYGCYERFVFTSGGLGSNVANYSYGLVPVLHITGEGIPEDYTDEESAA